MNGKHVKNLWAYAQGIIPVFQPSTKSILINKVKDNSRCVENTIILFSKHYIYSTRCKSERLSRTGLRNYCLEMKQMEEIIAKKNKKLTVHNLKWNGIEL